VHKFPLNPNKPSNLRPFMAYIVATECFLSHMNCCDTVIMLSAFKWQVTSLSLMCTFSTVHVVTVQMMSTTLCAGCTDEHYVYMC